MRIPSRCSCGGRALTYCTVQSERYTTRYRRCDSCGETLKSIQIRSLSSISLIDQVVAPVTIGESFEQKEQI
jgi:hypothetical protein